MVPAHGQRIMLAQNSEADLRDIPFYLAIMSTEKLRCLTEFKIPTMSIDVDLDVRGLKCPMPLLKAKRALNGMNPGELLQVIATDPGSEKDFRVFSEQSGHELVASEESAGEFRYVLCKKQN